MNGTDDILIDFCAYSSARADTGDTRRQPDPTPTVRQGLLPGITRRITQHLTRGLGRGHGSSPNHGTGPDDEAAQALRSQAKAPTDDAPVFLSTHHPVQGRPVLQEFEAYWRDLRGARQLPVRSDVNPSKIDAALPHAFIIEQVAPSVARLRVAGQRLNALLGMDARGMPLTTLFTNEARSRVAGYLQQVFEGPAIVELPLLSSRSLGRPLLSGRLLILPLGAEANEPRRAMGVFLVDGMIGTGPRRFSVPENDTVRCEHLPRPAPQRLTLAAGSDGAQHWQSGCGKAQKGTDSLRPALRLVTSED